MQNQNIFLNFNKDIFENNIKKIDNYIEGGRIDIEKKENKNQAEVLSCDNVTPRYTLDSPIYISGV